MNTAFVKLRLYVAIIIFLGLGLLAYLSFDMNFPRWDYLLLWSFILVLAEIIPVTVPQIGAAISIDSAILLTIILLFGPAVVAWFGVLSAIFCDGIVRKVPVYKAGFNGAQVVLAFGIAGLVYYYAGGIKFLPDLPNGYNIYKGIILPLFLSVITYFLVNSFSVSIAVGLQKNISTFFIWRSHFRWTFLNNILLVAPLALLMAFIQVKIGLWAVMFCFLPLFFVYNTFRLNVDLQREHLSAIAALCSAQDASDPYTFGHSERVSELAEMIARFLKLPDKEVETIKYAGQLHDIGKIGIDYKVVQKPGPLNLREWSEIKKHPAIGAAILKNLKFLKEATPYVEMHHERLDGGGYPLGRAGEEIPLGARIIKVADAFDAMTSERAYRPAMSIEQSIQLLKKDSGDQYDSRVVEALTELIAQGEIKIESSQFPKQEREHLEKSISQ